MKSGLKILSVAICLTLLTGCVSREQANDKLGKACEVAASIFLEDGFTIKTVKRVTSKPSKEYGDSYRDVTVFVTESDSWIDIEKEYECVFAEEFGMFNTSFDADLYRIGRLGGYATQNRRRSGGHDRLLPHRPSTPLLWSTFPRFHNRDQKPTEFYHHPTGFVYPRQIQRTPAISQHHGG